MKKQFQFGSLRKRLTFWFIIISIFPMIAAIIVIGIREADLHREEVFQKLEAIRDIKVGEVESWIDERIGDVRTIASDTEIRMLGKEVHYAKLENHYVEEIEVARRLINRYLAHYVSFSEIFLICNHTGKILLSTHEKNEGMDRSKDRYYTGAIEKQGIFIKDIYYSETENKRSMAFSIPVYDMKDNSHITSVLVARIDLDASLYKLLLDRTGLGETGETLIVNKDVVAINKLRWHKDAPLKLKIKSKPAIKAAHGNTGIVETYDYRGEQVLAAYTYIPITGWGFVAKQDLNEIYAHILELRIWLFVVWLVISTAIIMLALRVSRSFLKPVNALLDDMEIIGRGDLDHKIGTDSKDEIGELSRMFDQMTGNLSASLASRDALNREIAERKEAEKELVESEKKYRSLVDNAVAGIAYSTNKGEIMYANATLANMLEFESPEKLIESGAWARWKNPDDRKIMIEELSKTGRLASYEAELLTFTGKSIDVLFSSILEGDKITEVITDITERKKMEESLRESEEFIKNILETVKEGFVIINRDYRILLANKAYCEQVNMPVGKVLGKYCYRVSHHISRPCHESGEECSVKMAFDTGEPYTVRHTHYDKDGNPVYIDTHSYPLKDISGGFDTVIETTLDVTERVNLERQLIHSQKMEAVGQLAGGIAHDFNNILSAIMSYGHILQIKIKDKELAHNVDQILASTERAANLTTGLLAFGKKQIMSLEPVKLDTIITDVEKLITRLIGENIEMKIVLADHTPTILADSGQIAQVIMNLATNARDAMPEGGTITIKTGTHEIDDQFVKGHGYGVSGEYALFSVADTGGGIDDEIKDKIFEPFFTTKSTGTGLGLAIIYGIIKQHKGYIEVNSTPGKGTEFSCYLPLSSAHVKYAKPERIELPNTGTETILIVDDDNELRKSLKVILEEFGYTVIEAEDGEEAIKAFSKNRDIINILVLDVVLKKMSGRDVYEEIVKIRPDIKALFISGYSSEVIDMDELIEKGYKYMSKPFSPGMFIREIREILDE